MWCWFLSTLIGLPKFFTIKWASSWMYWDSSPCQKPFTRKLRIDISISGRKEPLLNLRCQFPSPSHHFHTSISIPISNLPKNQRFSATFLGSNCKLLFVFFGVAQLRSRTLKLFFCSMFVRLVKFKMRLGTSISTWVIKQIWKNFCTVTFLISKVGANTRNTVM